jgi:hypothetical protein
MSDAPWTRDYTYGCEPIPLSARMTSEHVAPATQELDPGCTFCLTLRGLIPWPCGPSAHERLTSKLK